MEASERSQHKAKVRSLEAALMVQDFTLYFLSQFSDEQNWPNALRNQVAAAHDAYREVTGEEPIGEQIKARAAARESERSK